MKKIVLKSTLTLSFALTFGIAHADAISELQQFNKEIKSASGSFSQKVIAKSGSVKKSSSGSFVFSRPGQFLWTYTAPYEQVLVSNGKTLTIYDKD